MEDVKYCRDCGSVLEEGNAILGIQCSECYYAIEESSDLAYHDAKLDY